ncbi:MAG: response regulator [Thermodesulfobacteriota bacterium]
MFKNRILLAILVPTIIAGMGVLFISTFLITRPLSDLLKEPIHSNLLHYSHMGLATCDERFSDLMDLHLEHDPAMNTASKIKALEEIKSYQIDFPGVEIIVVEDSKTIVGSTFRVPDNSLFPLPLENNISPVFFSQLWGENYLLQYRYFPFWKWHIISLISKKNYEAPIIVSRRIIATGAFGLMTAIVLTVFLLFKFRIDRPLNNIIAAVKKVATGNFEPVQIHKPDEIGQVASAFNMMIQNLAEDQKKIRSILSELKTSEEQYRIISEHSLANIITIRGNVLHYANRRALQTLEYSSDEILHVNLLDLIDPEDREQIRSKLLSLEKGEARTDHFECRVLTKTGKRIWFEVLAAVIPHKEREAILIHAVDITERKAAQEAAIALEERLSRAQKMEAVGALAGSVAHDLNNVLGGLLSYPELLLMDMPETSPMRKPLLTIRKSGEKAAAIVQDMLTLARRGVVVTEPINLNRIVKDYIKSPECEKLLTFHPAVGINIDLSPDLMNMVGSPVHLSKTVMNLVSNAAEAMPDGGTIAIITENRLLENPLIGYEQIPPGEYILLSVGDKGIGISDQDLRKIFEPFYTKKVMGRSGTGLGMAVVWGTLKDHHGFVDIHTSPGNGTRIDLYFPAARNVRAEQKVVSDIREFKGDERILIVDDIEEQRDIACRILTELGYHVESVSSGETALNYLKTHRVDLIVLDMIMDPGMDGLETFQEILKLNPGQKAIIASGFSETDRVREAQRIGAGAYVKKPYLMKTLGRAVRSELDRKQV